MIRSVPPRQEQVRTVADVPAVHQFPAGIPAGTRGILQVPVRIRDPATDSPDDLFLVRFGNKATVLRRDALEAVATGGRG